jgi:hypothetical protein
MLVIVTAYVRCPPPSARTVEVASSIETRTGSAFLIIFSLRGSLFEDRGLRLSVGDTLARDYHAAITFCGSCRDNFVILAVYLVTAG